MRLCECSSEHGPLYVCPSYSEDIKKKIKKLQKKFRKDILSGEAKFNITTHIGSGQLTRVTEVKTLNELFLEPSQ